MGIALRGHVYPGMTFLLLGFWHLFNHIKLHSRHSNSYISLPWFPTAKIRYLELYFIVLGSSISILTELVFSPRKHHPFDADGTIPSSHLHNFEHASISLSFMVYAVFSILLDKKIKPKDHHGLTFLVGAIAFGQQLLIFHLHSTDHEGLEWQYHMLLQGVIVVSLATTLMGIGFPTSFLVSFVRSLSILFQGIWLILIDIMLYTPSLLPKGCSLHSVEHHLLIRCAGEEVFRRAKSLVNIQFSWYVTGTTIFAMCFYFALVERYGKNVEYSSLAKEFEETHEDYGNIESPKKNKMSHSDSLIHMGKGFTTFDMEKQEKF